MRKLLTLLIAFSTAAGLLALTHVLPADSQATETPCQRVTRLMEDQQFLFAQADAPTLPTMPAELREQIELTRSITERAWAGAGCASQPTTTTTTQAPPPPTTTTQAPPPPTTTTQAPTTTTTTQGGGGGDGGDDGGGGRGVKPV